MMRHTVPTPVGSTQRGDNPFLPYHGDGDGDGDGDGWIDTQRRVTS